MPANRALCAEASRLVHRTVSPTRIAIGLGAYAKFWMLTWKVAASATSGIARIPHETARVTTQPRTARGVAILRGVPLVSADAPFVALGREAERIGVRLGAPALELCARYAELLIERNTTTNLTAITTPIDIARKHFLDSLTAIAVRRWSGRERVIDVGSGAGFPGLALRIAMPAIRLTLVESVGKKARFLEEVTTTLAIDGVEVRNDRAETLARERRDRYDVATARAVGSLGAVVEYLVPFLRVGGDAIAWKGRVDAELPGARKACAAVGAEIASITSTSALGLDDLLPGRSLVLVRKVRSTPARYPRASADAKRRPW